MPQRALSLKQPWAALLVHGLKTIEVRRWATSFRGPLLIHASTVDDDRPEAWAHVTPALRPTAELRGGIIGEGQLVECKSYRSPEVFQSDRPLHLNEPDWFEPAGLYGLQFTAVRTLPFRRYPGWMRIFEVDLENPSEMEGRSRTRKKQPQRDEAILPVVAGPTLSPAGSGTGFLVSVRQASEVEAALAGGATLIDVKEPLRGALGRADDTVIREVLTTVAGRAPVSAAQGEYALAPFVSADLGLDLVPGCSFVKWGPAGLGHIGNLRSAYERACALFPEVQAGGQVVLVGYADSQLANAPPLEEVCALACQKTGCVLLIDTFTKKGTDSKSRPTLLDFIPFPKLSFLCRLCRVSGVRLALAGSLSRQHIEQLLPLQPDWFAVRGAVCGGANREGSIEEALVRDLASLIRGKQS